MALNDPTDYDISNRGRLFDELEKIDECVRRAGADEMATHFDDSCHPKPPNSKEEGVTSRDGTQTVDIQADTLKMGKTVGDSNEDIFAAPLPEFENLGELEPTGGDLTEDLL